MAQQIRNRMANITRRGAEPGSGHTDHGNEKMIDDRDIWQGPDVVYQPGVCPNCASQRNGIYKTYPDGARGSLEVKNRLHKCENCGVKFRTYQELNRVDIPREKEGGGK